VRWRSSGDAGVPGELRNRIHALMHRFLEEREPTLVNRLLSDQSLSDELLINFLCYALDFSPMEKQALLESPSLAERGTRLCEVVQFALEAHGGAGNWRPGSEGDAVEGVRAAVSRPDNRKVVHHIIVRIRYPAGHKSKPREEVFFTSWAPGNVGTRVTGWLCPASRMASSERISAAVSRQ